LKPKGIQIDINRLKKSQLYSEELGINLWENDDREIFKWFLASLLFGVRISETIAKKTYKTFERYHLLEPKTILESGWDYLVSPIMREGGYVRYDGKTSTKVLRNCHAILVNYHGSLKNLHEEAQNSRDLESKLTGLYGIGPVTANIFLRELRTVWEKCDPDPLPVVKEMAERFKIDLGQYDRKSEDFIRIEAGLIRLKKQKKQSPCNPLIQTLNGLRQVCTIWFEKKTTKVC